MRRVALAAALIALFLLGALVRHDVDALDRLAHVRATATDVAADAILPTGLGLAAADRPEAVDALRAVLAAHARATGIEDVALTTQPAAADAARIGIDIRARATQPELLRFAAAIERDPRELRFERWVLRGDGVDVRLEGVLRAMWRLP